MKTSNKLLLGLFGIIVVAMIIGNIFLKKEMTEMTEKTKINQQVEMNTQNDSTSTDSSTVHINLQ